jgi:hypothetical protein
MSTFTDRQYAHDLIERLDSSMVVTAEEEQAIRRSEAWFEKNGGKRPTPALSGNGDRSFQFV